MSGPRSLLLDQGLVMMFPAKPGTSSNDVGMSPHESGALAPGQAPGKALMLGKKFTGMRAGGPHQSHGNHLFRCVANAADKHTLREPCQAAELIVQAAIHDDRS